jgi:catechol 2,3-dioxygenase-like lactoylglutathione lyase family enzyme
MPVLTNDDPMTSRRVRAQPLLAVRDVRASAIWYEQLLGLVRLGPSDHDHVYQRLLDDGGLVLQLHSWDDEDHPNLTDPEKAPCGHGVLVWFEVDDFDAALTRARKMNSTILLGPEVNENSGCRELWIRDHDGYVVVVASRDWM